MWTWFYRLASPPFVYRVAATLTPWFLGLAALTIGYGVIDGLAFAPPDYQQGDAFRIIYVHVPAASKWDTPWPRRRRPSAPRSRCWRW